MSSTRQQNEEGMLLRIFVSESDKCQGKPLYEQRVLRAEELEISGATGAFVKCCDLVNPAAFGSVVLIGQAFA